MRIGIRSVALLSSLSIILALGSVSLIAQEPKQKEASKGVVEAPPTAKKLDPARRVPPYFGQIGLRPEQREEIYKVRAKHIKKIDELEAKVEAIRSEMLAECEGVLDQTQKQVLVSRRKSGLNPETAPAATPKQ